MQNFIIRQIYVRATGLQNEVCTKDFSRATKFVTKNALKFAPKFLRGKRETHKQNPPKNSGKGRDSPGMIPAQSREMFVYAFSCLLVFPAAMSKHDQIACDNCLPDTVDARSRRDIMLSSLSLRTCRCPLFAYPLFQPAQLVKEHRVFKVAQVFLRVPSNMWFFRNTPQYSGKKRAHKVKKIPGTPAGCPWDTRQDKQGSTGRCPSNFLLFIIEKRTERGIFAGTPAGCPRDTRPSRGFSEILCDFFLCALSAS